MINLITGQPGSGKTLRTLYEVQQLAEKEGRQVFYSGINDLRLPWTELERGEDWHSVPVGSIVVIDECQRIFRPRGNGSSVPEYVAKFETHRHQGLDIFLITQHPMLLDSNIRRLCGRHLHVMRAFGAKAANLHEWGEVREQCDKNRSGSISTLWKYPAHVFDFYKSAEMHTHKFRLPPRVYFLLLIPLVLAVVGWVLYQWWAPRLTGETHKEMVKSAVQANGGAVAVGKPPSDGSKPAVKDRTEYLAELEPRIPGLLHTAPAYDSITQPKQAPEPMCIISSKNGCRCFDQQGNRYQTSNEICLYLVKNGIFLAWKEPRGQSAAVASSPPLSQQVGQPLSNQPQQPPQASPSAVSQMAGA